MSIYILPPFLGTNGCSYVAKERDDAIGIIWITPRGPGNIMSVDLMGHPKVEWIGPYTEAEFETFKEFDLFPVLVEHRTATSVIKTMGSGDVHAYQMTYRLPHEGWPGGEPEPWKVVIPLEEMFHSDKIGATRRSKRNK
jgi:hypothetical protein